MVFGTKIRLMGSALTLIQMVENTKVSILMENWKVKESILGLMEGDMRVTTKWTKNMVMEPSNE